MANTSSNALSRRSWDRFSLVFIESGCSTAGMQVSQVCVCVCVSSAIGSFEAVMAETRSLQLTSLSSTQQVTPEFIFKRRSA